MIFAKFIAYLVHSPLLHVSRISQLRSHGASHSGRGRGDAGGVTVNSAVWEAGGRPHHAEASSS
jgi:hypothetical protein